MKVTKKINLHLDDLRRIPPIDVMQGDAYTRELEFSLYSGGEAWNVPDGVSVAVAYHGASGQGAYDTLQDDATKAYTVSGNVVTITLIPQVAAVPGYTTVSVMFTDTNGKQLTTFGVVIDVKRNPAIGAGTPENYYNLREWLGAGTYYIRIDGNAGNEIDEDYGSILQECESGRAVAVCLETAYDRVTLPFVKANAGGELYFSTVCDGKEWQVIITRNPEDGSANVAVKTLSVADSPEMYFDITDDGMISLKPEYRGACTKSEFTYGVSDNGIKVNGSKNSELPESIVIPEIVNEIAVTALAPAMFAWNNAVKSIIIPTHITEIPSSFCRASACIKAVSGTENVKVLGDSAFRQTLIEKISLPALERADGNRQFHNCVYLTVADIGNKITALPDYFFGCCERLSCVRNGESITSVGGQSFYVTRRLMPPVFLPKLKNIGAQAFRMGRVSYDWASLVGCTFGANATSLQLNPTDYWSACAYTPCNTPMRSTFSQKNPAWVNNEVGNTGYTYSNGCVVVSAAMIYSALMGVDISSPEEYVAQVEAVAPDVSYLVSAFFTNQKQYLEAVGLSAEYREGMNAANLQAIYDALADGALVLAGIDEAHAVVFHGVTEKGELRVTDPQCYAYMLGDYRAHTYTMPIQNLMLADDHFLIVTKP